MPSRVIDNKSPYEILYNKPPSLDHLRVIGCKANAYNLTTDKFAPKSTPTVLIGYPQNQKGYLLYDTTTHKVITTRNVTFDEHVFPFHTINTPSPSQSQTDPYNSPLQFTSDPPITPPPTITSQPYPPITTTNSPPPSSATPTTPPSTPLTQTPTISQSPAQTAPSQEPIPSPPTAPPPPLRQSTRIKTIPTKLQSFQYQLQRSLIHSFTTKHHTPQNTHGNQHCKASSLKIHKLS